MSPEVTQSVLMDVLLATGVALTLGLIIYQLVRARTGEDWSRDGNVLTRPYGMVDGVVALLLVGLMSWPTAMGQTEPNTENIGLDEFVDMMFISSLFMVSMVVVLAVYLSFRGMNPVEMFGLRSVPIWRSILLAVGWLVGVLIFMMIAMVVGQMTFFDGQVPEDSPQEVIEKFKQMEHWGQRGMVILSAVLLAPVTEEVIFRGFLYGVTKRFTDRWFAALVTGLIFAVGHQHVGSLFPLFLLGLGFALAYESTGSLLVPIFMHMMFNGMNVLRMVMVDG